MILDFSRERLLRRVTKERNALRVECSALRSLNRDAMRLLNSTRTAENRALIKAAHLTEQLETLSASYTESWDELLRLQEVCRVRLGYVPGVSADG